jgi:LysM repeat protein
MNTTASKVLGLYKWIIPLVTGIVVGAIGWFGILHLCKTPYTILVDGKPVATVESFAAAKTVLKEARTRRIGNKAPGEVRFAVQVSLKKAKRDVSIVDIPEAVRAVETAAPVEVEGYAIVVDDEPILALQSEKQAQESLRLLKDYYSSKLPEIHVKPSFKEQVYIEKRFVDPAKLCTSPGEALDLMISETTKPVYYTIKAGDRAVKIAAEYGISLNELKAINPKVDLNRLVEGDRLMVRKGRKPITVVHKARIVQTVTVTPPPTAPYYLRNKTGKRTVTTIVTYENGEPVSQEIISQVTTWNRSKGINSPHRSLSKNRE